MTDDNLREALIQFAAEKNFKGQGPICVALVVTKHARDMGFPLDSEKLVTGRGGQVLGLGKGAVQSILKKHGITRLFAAEGGRTSRGSLDNMRGYVAFLNRLHEEGLINLDAIEAFWIEKVKEFFAAKPFKIRMDASHSLRAVVRDVLSQAEERQRHSGGVYYVGAMLQHLVGAKLDCALGEGKFSHNSFSTADAPSQRKGDFFVGDVVIHVTTSPGEAVIERCRDNLNDGYRPVLVTLQRGLTVAEALADNKGIGHRIDVFEIEQFVALNLYELGQFGAAGRKTAIVDLVRRYNEIIEEVQTDPSLKIELKR